MSRFWPRNRWLRVLLIGMALAAIAWFVVPPFLVPKIRGKLQAMLSSQLDAELRIGRLAYSPPYGLRARDVSLITNDPEHGYVELLKVAVLDLELAKLPFGDGPLVIENITLREPEVRIVRVGGGRVVGQGRLVREDRDGDGDPDRGPGQPLIPSELNLPETKLSAMFLLRHLGIEGGRVAVEDRTRPDLPPMVWGDLGVAMQTAPKSGSAYEFRLDSDGTGPGRMEAAGAFDLDALWIDVTKLHVACRTDPGEHSALPAQVQSVLRRYEVRGNTALDAAGRIELRDLPASRFAGTIELSGASALVPQARGAIDRVAARVAFSRQPASPDGPIDPAAPMHVKLEHFSLDSGGDRLDLTGGAATINRAAGTWAVEGLGARLQFAHAEAAPPVFAPAPPAGAATVPPEAAPTTPAAEPAPGAGRAPRASAAVTPAAMPAASPAAAPVAAPAPGGGVVPVARVAPTSEAGRGTNSAGAGTTPAAAPAGGGRPRSPAAGAARRPSLFAPLGSAGRIELDLSCGGRIGRPMLDGGLDVIGLSAALRAEALTVLPPGFDVPLNHVTGSVRKEAGARVVALTDTSLAYAADRLRVRRVRLELPADVRAIGDAFRLDELAAVADFGLPHTPYPGKVGRIIAELSPSGRFNFGGGSWFTLTKVEPPPDESPDDRAARVAAERREDAEAAAETAEVAAEEAAALARARGETPTDAAQTAAAAVPPAAAPTTAAASRPRRRSDYFISVSTDRGRFDLFDGRLPLTEMRGDVEISPLSVHIERLQATALGGSLLCGVHITPKEPVVYEGEAYLSDVDLAAVGAALDLSPEQRERLGGKAFVNMKYEGEFPDDDESVFDALAAAGQFEIFGGSFWRLPVFTHLAEGTKQAHDLTIGEAAGRFEIARRTLVLRNAVVSSPALGLLGSGKIGFDKTLDLKVVAAPLGDWRARMKRGNDSAVADAAAEVAGAVQSLLTAATSTLLYEFRVGGTTSDPALETVPVPILDDAGAALFGQMAGDAQDRRWAEAAKGK